MQFNFTPVLGEPENTGVVKCFPEDFQVIEQLGFAPLGQGDHVYLFVEKKDCNTDWVASQLAKLAKLKPVDVGYAGKKDRHAVTRQWFSLHIPNQPEPDWTALPDQVTLLSRSRHQKKLKIGALNSNKFNLVIRELTGSIAELEQRLICLKQQGMPNYFGGQRFGHDNQNVQRLIDMFEQRRKVKKTQRSMYISAGRSYLFNRILQQRVRDNTWNKLIEGDVVMLDGSNAIFAVDENDAQLETRLAQHDIHPATILWGIGEGKSRERALTIESEIIANNPQIVSALEKVGSKLAYRAMRVNLDSLHWSFDNNVLGLSFELPPGAYATSLLNELIRFKPIVVD